MGAPGTTKKVTISKCPCGDRMCSSYRLSNQGSAGFELEDAHQMAASGALYDAVEALVEHCEYQHLREIGYAALAQARGESS